MKVFYVFLLTALFTLQLRATSAQQIKFNRITKDITQQGIFYGIAQDRQGFIWAVGFPGGSTLAALYRFDDTGYKAYESDPHKPNTIQNSIPLCLFIDHTNKLWIGFYGGGIDRFDPLNGTFTNFRHHAKDASSLTNDTVYSILQDHTGKIWVGTTHGLDLMDNKTGKFTHYQHLADDPKSISGNNISFIYEDRSGEIWIGCSGITLTGASDHAADDGLNLFHKKTGTFTHYLHNPGDPSTLSNNNVSCIYEDKTATFWVGTQGNGLQTLDRKTGKFTYYQRDHQHSEGPGSFPTGKEFKLDRINFMSEDIKGGLWFGLSGDGLYRYDPSTKKTAHFGSFFRDTKVIYKDTAGGVPQFAFLRGFNSTDGLFWTSAFSPAAIFNINLINYNIPFVPLNANGNAFYQEPGGNTLWIGTNKGLIKKNLVNKTEKVWSKDQPENSGWAHDTIGNMTRDKNGVFWIATLGGGLCRFDPVANKAFYYLHDKNNPNSISSNLARNLLIDHDDNIWIGTWGAGLDMLDTKTQKFTHYIHSKDSAGLSNNVPDCIYEDKDHAIWVGGYGGLDRLDKDGKSFHHYLSGNATLTLYTDHSGKMWAGGNDGLSFYDKKNERFLPFIDPATGGHLGYVTDIQEDTNNNLWLRTIKSIVKINERRNQTTVYGETRGVNVNNEWICRSLKGQGDEMFFGTLNGYFDFFPEKITVIAPPVIAITEFLTENGDKQNGKTPLINYDTKEIELTHDQNNFSFDYVAIHFNSPGEEKYQVKLENYDYNWRDLSIEHRTPFFEIPPGKYILRIKAFNADGAWAERDLSIIISPPWWKTWWAYTLFGLAICGAIWAFIEYRGRKLVSENKVLEQKIDQRTEELQKSLEELKATQTQLIQSEKMASLGELTAGIAHEIQNPLNFVNNFSEVSIELLEEMGSELNNGDKAEALAIADDIKLNLEKIRHHGKRADSIVKGMLEHSRTSSGKKELTDLNTLADEYLRLSYHGLRAKDKSFNAELVTHFDDGLPKITVIQQDIGRVLLNLFNNAFYAVQEKRKTEGVNYNPVVEVITKVVSLPPDLKGSQGKGQAVEIIVKDNGNGIPEAIKDKIMQPFFTTKPTGEGTGLGLSISYDIVVKGHGGKIAVSSEANTGSEFIVTLPV